jgi:hypothetical protein
MAGALLPLIAAHDPGCGSLGQISEEFELWRNLVQVALRMHTINIRDALAAVFIPPTFAANLKTPGIISGGRHFAGVVRMAPVRAGITGDTVVPQEFGSDLYGDAVVTPYFVV